MGVCEIFRGADRQWYFRVKALNGKVIAQSEGYKRKQGAMRGINSLKENLKGAFAIELLD